MGFSALLQSGICCGAFVGAQHCSSTGSPLFGSVLRQPARVYAVINNNNNRKLLAVTAVGEEPRNPPVEEEKRSALLGVASASIGFNTVLLMSVTKPMVPLASSHKDAPFGWLSLPLLAVWGAILVNAFVQYRILGRLTTTTTSRGLPQERRETSAGRVDSSLKERVAELDDQVREFVTTARALSKQVEKLGVRFRATKRTLRDPIQEAAAFAQKASEVTSILAQREARLEEELRELQRALLAMQEHQVKQLALISLALKRTQKGSEGTKKKLPSSVNGISSAGIQTSADTSARGRDAAQDAARDASRDAARGKGASNGNSSASFSTEGSLSKVDFWKDSVTSSAVVEKMAVRPLASDHLDHSSKLGSFFNGRQRGPRSSPPESNLNADVHSKGLESEVLPEAEYVEQPDYDSDSWLR